MIMGRKWSEHVLIAIAYALEQVTQYRRLPPSLPALAADADVPRLEPAEYNELSLTLARRAFEEVLQDGGKFDLTGVRMREITDRLLEERGLDFLR